VNDKHRTTATRAVFHKLRQTSVNDSISFHILFHPKTQNSDDITRFTISIHTLVEIIYYLLLGLITKFSIQVSSDSDVKMNSFARLQ